MQTYIGFKNECLAPLVAEYLNQVLQAANGNMSEAGRIAGVDRKYLYRLLKSYNVRLAGPARKDLPLTCKAHIRRATK